MLPDANTRYTDKPVTLQEIKSITLDFMNKKHLKTLSTADLLGILGIITSRNRPTFYIQSDIELTTAGAVIPEIVNEFINNTTYDWGGPTKKTKIEKEKIKYAQAKILIEFLEFMIYTKRNNLSVKENMSVCYELYTNFFSTMNTRQPIYVKDFIFNHTCEIDNSKYGYNSKMPTKIPGVYILKRKYYDIIIKYNNHDYRRWSRQIHEEEDPALAIYKALYESIQTAQDKPTSSSNADSDGENDDDCEDEEEIMLVEDEQGEILEEELDERADQQTHQKKTYTPCLKIQRIPFYGAYVHDAKPQLNVSNPVTVMDATSLYPFAIVWINLGLESRVRYSTIKPLIDKNLVVENVDFIASHFSRSDDFPNSWRLHYDEGHDDYIRMNYVFYWCKRKSIMVEYYKDLIDLRVSYKRRGNTAMSNALKLIINSMYGTLAPRAQPSVTGMGRMFLHIGIHYLRDHFEDDTISILYCDTDSIFFMFKKTAREILALSNEERDASILKVNKHDFESARGKFFTKANEVLTNGTNRDMVIYVSIEFFNFINQYFAEYLNKRAHSYSYLNFETEKTFCPYLQNCRKKYIGFKANEAKLSLTMKGISEKNSSKLKILLNKSLCLVCWRLVA